MITAFIPQIGKLEQGLDYDMALSERVNHTNEITDHPIEETYQSFISDHNRKKPITLAVTLEACTYSISQGTDIDRLARLYQKLIEMKDRQTVDPSAFVTIFTGVRIYRNMALVNVTESRQETKPDQIILDLRFKEMRVGTSPRLLDPNFYHRASDGRIQESEGELVNFADRFVIEGTIPRRRPRTGEVPANLLPYIYDFGPV